MSLWCEVNKDILLDNLKVINGLHNKKSIAVVKGEAYGLGAQQIVDIIGDSVDMFAVSSTDEALKLRTDKDILIMSPLSIPLDEPKDNYIYTIDDYSDLYFFNKNIQYRVHIYIDTGMNRLGIKANKFNSFLMDLRISHPHIKIEGVYTHLHNATNVAKSKKQIDILKSLWKKHGDIDDWHCLNSKGILNDDLRNYASFTTMARYGNALYGYEEYVNGLKRVFEIKAKISKRYVIEEDGYIGYGEKSRVKKGTIIGIIPIGTINKFGYVRDIDSGLLKDVARLFKKKIKPNSSILYKDKPLHIVCSPNMNCTLVDITSVHDCKNLIVDIKISTLLMDSNIKKIFI